MSDPTTTPATEALTKPDEVDPAEGTDPDGTPVENPSG